MEDILRIIQKKFENPLWKVIHASQIIVLYLRLNKVTQQDKGI